MEDYEGILIRQDTLIRSHWQQPTYRSEESDEIATPGRWIEEDVSADLPMSLMESCRVESGTTLRDLFKLLGRHRDFLSTIERRNWFLDWLDFGLRSPISDLSRVEDPSELQFDFLEIYKVVSHTQRGVVEKDKYFEYGVVGNPTRTRTKISSAGDLIPEETCLSLGFHGISKPLTKAYTEKYPHEKDSLGQQIPIGFMGSSLPSFIDFPLRLNTTLRVDSTDYSKEKPNHTTQTFGGFESFTLIEIVEAVFWELSFHGSPADTEEVNQEIGRRMDRLLKEEEALVGRC